MKVLISYLALLLMINTQVMAEDVYTPNSGDAELDDALILIQKKLNRTNKTKLTNFVDNIAEYFQVPVGKVEALFNIYELKAQDVLMSVAVADVSGEPLQNISAVYTKNKEKGWIYTLKKMNIKKGSPVFKQIKKDITAEY